METGDTGEVLARMPVEEFAQRLNEMGSRVRLEKYGRVLDAVYGDGRLQRLEPVRFPITRMARQVRRERRMKRAAMVGMVVAAVIGYALGRRERGAR